MWLPRELMDTVTSNFVSYRSTVRNDHIEHPFRGWDFYVKCPNRPVDVTDPACETTFAVPEIDWQSVLSLRLVSRAWCVSATDILARYHTWVLRFNSFRQRRNTLAFVDIQSIISRDGRDKSEAQSTVASAVRNLAVELGPDKLTFKRRYRIEDGSQFQAGEFEEKFEELAERFRVRENENSLRNTTAVQQQHESARSPIIRSLLGSLRCVKQFAVSFPSVSSIYLDAPFYEVICYDEEAVAELLNTFYHALLLPAFRHVVDLRLELPTTRDIGLLAGALSQEARSMLQHLLLRVVDETGPGGSQSYRNESQNDDGTENGYLESGYFPSNWQHKFPNQAHQDELFALVSSCRNLRCLAIDATHYLDLDRLHWLPSRGLEMLSLQRLWASEESLIRLLSPSPESTHKPVIRRANLEHVQFKPGGGTWLTVFRFLEKECPDLEYYSLNRCSHFEDAYGYIYMTFGRIKMEEWERTD